MESNKAVRMEVSMNGEVLATGGVPAFGVLTAVVSWVRPDPQRMPPEVRDDPDRDPQALADEQLMLEFGALDGERDVDLKWLSEHGLAVGDEIRVRLLPPGPVDRPAREVDVRPPAEDA